MREKLHFTSFPFNWEERLEPYILHFLIFIIYFKMKCATNVSKSEGFEPKGVGIFNPQLSN